MAKHSIAVVIVVDTSKVSPEAELKQAYTLEATARNMLQAEMVYVDYKYDDPREDVE